MSSKASSPVSPGSLLDAWLDAYEASVIRMPGQVKRSELGAALSPIVTEMAAILTSGCRFRPGSHEVRELEHLMAFAAAQLAAQGQSGFDLGALMLALRDMARANRAFDDSDFYFEWLAIVAQESRAGALVRAAEERWRRELEEGTPVVMVLPELPAAFFVCNPDRAVVTSTFGRLLLSVVRTGARGVIVDVTSCSVANQECFVGPLTEFLGHPRVRGKATVFMCGVAQADEPRWTKLAEAVGARLVLEPYFDECVAAARELR